MHKSTRLLSKDYKRGLKKEKKKWRRTGEVTKEPGFEVEVEGRRPQVEKNKKTGIVCPLSREQSVPCVREHGGGRGRWRTGGGK